MALYAVEKENSSKCGLSARNCEYFTKLQSAEFFACLGHGRNADIRVGDFLDNTAKVYNAKEGHEEYADAVAWITRIEVNRK